MGNLKKLIARVLIVSMILTSHSFCTFAEGVADETFADSVTKESYVGEKTAASLSQTEEEDADGDEEIVYEYEEEPEEDETEETTSEETTIVEETTVEETAAEETIVEETAAEEKTVEETTAEEKIVEETTAEEKTAEETTVEETAAEEATTVEETKAEATEEEIETTVEATESEIEETYEVEEKQEKEVVKDEVSATESEIELSIDLASLNPRERLKLMRERTKLFGGPGDQEFDIEARLTAYLNINTYEYRNYPEGYGKVSISFGRRYPVIQYMFYHLEQGDGDDVDDGEFYDFTYPSEYALNDVKGVYVLDENDKPIYKLTGWKYRQNGEELDFPSDISHLDEDNWWPYEWAGESRNTDLDDWVQYEVFWSHLGNMDYWSPDEDHVYIYFVPQWAPVTDEEELYHAVIDWKKDLDYAEPSKSYPDTLWLTKKSDTECFTDLDDKYFDESATDTGITIDYANKTITLHSNTAKVEGIDSEGYTCNEYKVGNTSFAADTPIPFSEIFTSGNSVTLTPIWVKRTHTIQVKFFDYKDNIDFNSETPVGIKEFTYGHGEIDFIDIRREDLLLNLYKEAEASVWTSDPSFAYNENIDMDNPDATESIIKYSIYKESHSDTIYMEKGKTILVNDAVINLSIKRGATLIWTSKAHGNDYTNNYKDKNDDYVNIKNGRLPKFSEIPNTGIVFNFTVSAYEHKNTSGTYYHVTDNAVITSSEQLKVFLSGTGELPLHPPVESFIIATPPNFVDYKTGDTFDPSGLDIIVTYEGIAETRRVLYDEHKSEFTFTPSLEDRIAPTSTYIAITFGGVTVNQPITVDTSPHARAFYYYLENIGEDPASQYYETDMALHFTSVYEEGRKMISGTGPINYEGVNPVCVNKVCIDDEIIPETCERMFCDFDYLYEIENFSNLNTSKAISMKEMFRNTGSINGDGEPALKLDFRHFDTSNVTDMSYMFCRFMIEDLDLGSFDTSKVVTMESMFDFSYKIKSLYLGSFNTSNVKNMARMFCNCSLLPKFSYNILGNFDTSNVTNMSEMFSSLGCDYIDLSRFVTINVTDMSSMFANNDYLEELDLSGFETRNVTNMQNMFSNLTKIKELDLSSFDTRNLTNMQDMFSNSTEIKEIDLSSFDTSRVTNMHGLFDGCTSLTTIYASDGFATTAVEEGENSRDLFAHCYELVGGNGTRWNDGRSTGTILARIDTEGEPGYFTGRERKPFLDYIEVATPSTKVKYNQGEHFDPTGLIIKEVYSNGIEKNVAYDDSTKDLFTFTPGISSELRSFNFFVTIKYKGLVTAQNISVSGEVHSVDSATIETSPQKTVYNVGDSVDLTGLIIKVVLNDGTTVSVPFVNGKDFITYNDKTLNSGDTYIEVVVYGTTVRVPIQVGGGYTPSGGSGSRGGSSGSSATVGPMGDLTKNPAYAYLFENQTYTFNNLSATNLLSNNALAITLLADYENANRANTNVVDINGNTGFGKWQKAPGTTIWYFLSGDIAANGTKGSVGFISNGWYNLGWNGNTGWYHFDTAGVMQVGWYEENGKRYYFNTNPQDSNYGKSVTGTVNINGTIYNFDANGALIS